MNNGNYWIGMPARIRAACSMLSIFGLAMGAGAALGQPVEGTDAIPVAHVENVQPFTHVASIPADVDPATIRLEKVRATKVATQIKYTMDAAYCRSIQDDGMSLYCPQTELQSYVPAYALTYSFAGPLDEYGNSHSTFEVYLRAEEMPSSLKDELASHKLNRGKSTEYFTVTTLREPVRRAVIDEAKSNVCAGRFVDGAWTHADARCEDKLSYKTVMAPSDSLSVRVEAISSFGVQATNRSSK